MGLFRGVRFVDLVLCAIAAVLTFISFPTELAPEHSFWPLIWLSHVPLLWLLKDKSPKQAFYWGLVCGFLINTGGYYWMASMLRTFGALPWPVAIFIMLLHSAQLGLIWALWAWLVNRITNTTSIPIEWTVPTVMVAVEFLMPRIFPAYMGNSQYLFPIIMQISDIFGVTCVTWLIYRVNTIVFLWVRAWFEGRTGPIRATYLTAFLLAVSFVYGGVRMAQFDNEMNTARKLRVGLVEADIGIFQVETVDRRRNHLLVQQALSKELEGQGVDLIVWPESAYRAQGLPRLSPRFVPSKTPLVDHWRKDIRTPAADRLAPQRGFSTPLLFGGTSVEPSQEPRWEGDGPTIPRNTAFLLGPDGAVLGAYDKVYLLAFGEYVPFIDLMPWFYKYVPTAGNLSPGDTVDVIEAQIGSGGPVRIGVLICYEGILPSFARGLSEKKPNFLVNMTNDDWFGKTAERYLHFALTVPRAIEHRLPFVRSTLTGVSAFVDANGRVIKDTSMYGAETLVWDVPILTSSTIYQRSGDIFPWTAVGLVLLWYLWGRIRRRST